MSGRNALIIGATGAVGKVLLKELLGSAHFTRVGEFGRRITPLHTPGLPHPEKLVQKTLDFEKPNEAGLTDEKWDVVFITMGTTRKQAGSAEQFIKIDQNYVVDAARAAKNSQHEQRLVYLSSIGADFNSRMLYTRSKGETEERLASLGYSDTIIFRPAMLLGAERPGYRPLESLALTIVNPLTALSNSLGIKVASLAKSIRIAAELGSSALPATTGGTLSTAKHGTSKYTIIPNSGALKLAEE